MMFFLKFLTPTDYHVQQKQKLLKLGGSLLIQERCNNNAEAKQAAKLLGSFLAALVAFHFTRPILSKIES